MSYKYKLENYSGKNSRYTCPGCNEKNEFTRYISVETNEHVAENVGKCNRVDKCGYHYCPQQYFKENEIKPPVGKRPIQYPQSISPTSFIENDTFVRTLREYGNNNFIQYLIGKFGTEKTDEQVRRYHIGTSKYWQGATIFWQQDVKGKIRTGKIMLYNPDTGKRVKEPHNYITWAHRALKLPKYHLKQCFFGEHLLAGNEKPVAIVESEKTALVASIFIPDLIWIATGNKDGLTMEKCEVLKDRKVVLYPDLRAYECWYMKAIAIPYLNGFSISNLLEKKASPCEREEGLDLADYLLRFDYPQS